MKSVSIAKTVPKTPNNSPLSTLSASTKDESTDTTKHTSATQNINNRGYTVFKVIFVWRRVIKL